MKMSPKRKPSPKWYIPNIRENYEEVKELTSGFLYLKGNVMQVWWMVDSLGRPFETEEKGRETWTFPTVKDAKDSFRTFQE